MRAVTPEAVAEINRLLEAGGGVVQAKAVLAAAKAEKSPLHSYFEWDDTEAAKAFRLKQARELIVAVHVTIQTDEARTITVPAFVSLASDRLRPGGGFRSIQTVLSDNSLRNELLATALAELSALHRRYRHLTELAAVFTEAEKVLEKVG